ncbi:hypothetical protein FDT66_08240 [Polaribacter aestuariivivens]|uniref:WG repeat-containing protein n=1 Tax=Polaribacter aestuariivivens TaxID=2304626 RepID=A0A5S3N4S1_9FLAO|nr:hypothetical protein [Polaribacter aestuariivivens]TMM29852.1 hypothetical protein FDT66_08240 [Polaribacter aestuariivivens]
MKKTTLLIFIFLLFTVNSISAQNNKNCDCEWNGKVIPELNVPPCEYTDNRKDDSYRKYAAYACCLEKCKEKHKKSKTISSKNSSKKSKTISKNNQSTISLDDLNSQLELVSKEAKNLEDVNTIYDVSFDDILSKRTASKKSNNQLDDSFLNNSNSESNNDNLDFLTQETVSQKNNSSFKIDYKNDLQGVINPETNKVLIPYKKWSIEKFQDGIAKVSIDIDSEKICSCRLGYYSASVKEVGYVDERGQFIDGSRKVITGSFKNETKLLIVKGNYNKAASDLRDKRDAQECIKKGKQWKIEAKRRYL